MRKELTAIINRKLYLAYDRSLISAMIQLVARFDKDPDKEDKGEIVPIVSFKELAKIILPLINSYEYRDITTDFKTF
jgi:hypothetical protein